MQEAVILTEEQKEAFDSVVSHPIQSWDWGTFKQKMGAIPERIGIYENGKMVSGVQVVFSKVPKTKFTVGLITRAAKLTPPLVSVLRELAKKHHTIFIKYESASCIPISQNAAEPTDEKIIENFFREETDFLLQNGGVTGKPFFEKFNFLLDIDKPEEELMRSFHSKTRYNIRLAARKGVTIIDNSTEEGIEDYIRLMEETTKRQGFFNHNAEYFRSLFKLFPKNRLRVFEAVYNGEVLTAWILFHFNGKLYYPYGASSNNHREVMPNNLIMWKAIQYGKSQGCTVFDLWGCLGPNPDEHDSWYGFHKFKSGYNPQLVEYGGTYDLVYKPVWYKLFLLADKIRWSLLRAKKKRC